MDERGPWTGHLTKPAQVPVVTVERIESEQVSVSGVFALARCDMARAATTGHVRGRNRGSHPRRSATTRERRRVTKMIAAIYARKRGGWSSRLAGIRCAQNGSYGHQTWRGCEMNS